jgi:hypothetical protein
LRDETTGFQGVKQTNNWTLQRFTEHGVEAHLESWTFGGTRKRGSIEVRLTAPRAHDLIAESWGRRREGLRARD